MPPDLDALSALAVSQAEQFQKDARAIDRAWRGESLAALVEQLKAKAIEDGERIDNHDA
jgi:hypothetical protein